MSFTEEVLLTGHIIDSLTLPRVLDVIMDAGGDYAVLELEVGKQKADTSRARVRISASSEEQLADIVRQVQGLGAELLSAADVRTAPCPMDGVLPDGFYSTTNYPTEVKLAGEWVQVSDIEMDVAVIVDRAQGAAHALPMAAVKQGQPVAVGHEGIRVRPPERSRGPDLSFSFMSSEVSSEKPKKLAIEAVAREMKAIHERGQRIVVVGGPAIVHTGAAPYLATLIREGYVDVLLGGNRIAVHDVEAAMLGTSLGVHLETASPVEGGHHHHMRAINAIRRAGSLKAAVDTGVLTKGIMYEAIRKGIDIVLAGSIRDDGPLPDTITDVVVAQQRMREAVKGAGICLMICTMLHSIATGNMLPAHVRTVVVDINPATVTKLADRGSWQAIGLVTDAELFLRELVSALGLRS